MKKTTHVKAKAQPIPADQLAKLLAMQDEAIDYSDTPKTRMQETTDGVVGRFYRPIKKPIYTNIDADVLDWLKSMGRGYQTRINAILRQAMLLGSAPRMA